MYKEIYVLECWKNHSQQDGLSMTSCKVKHNQCRRQILSFKFIVIQYKKLPQACYLAKDENDRVSWDSLSRVIIIPTKKENS